MTEETINYLRKAKVSEQEIARLQWEELNDHALNILRKALACIESENYSSIEKMTFFSPAGDGYGLDNSCLNFGTERDTIDIRELTDQLNSLKKVSKSKKK